MGATCLISIFAAEILLTIVLFVFAYRLATGRTRVARLPLDAPILAFSVWTLLSASFSPHPLVSFENAKKIVLFSVVYLGVDSLTREKDREKILATWLLGGVVLAAGAVLQYLFLGYDTLNHRPTSFLGHYMTASGLAMAVLMVAAARLGFGALPGGLPRRADLLLVLAVLGALGLETACQAAGLFGLVPERLVVLFLAVGAIPLAGATGAWPSADTTAFLAALAVPLASWALVVSQTRGAWLGALSGLAWLAILKAPRTLWILAAGAGLFLLLRGDLILGRVTVSDPSSVDRYYMWQAGVDMVEEKPIFGQGPGMIQSVYPLYRWPQAPNPVTPHLHDNALQIAAERGLPCLAFWIWWMASSMGDAYRESRSSPRAWGAYAALGVLTAVMVSGLFEYNFGDSEVLIFTLVASAIPYALRRERAEA